MRKARKVTESYTWVVEAFSFLDSAVDECIVSQKFVLCGNAWRLSVYPGGTTMHPAQVMIYLYNMREEPVTASYEFAILNADDTVKTSRPCDVDRFAQADRPKSGWAPVDWLETEDVMDPTNGFLHDDTLRIKVTVTMVKQGDDTTALSAPKPEKALADLASLLDSGSYRSVSCYFTSQF